MKYIPIINVIKAIAYLPIPLIIPPATNYIVSINTRIHTIFSNASDIHYWIDSTSVKILGIILCPNK
jgi:hypothetical protein